MTLCHLPCCGQGGRSCQGNSYAFLEYELPSGQGESVSAWTGPAPPFTLPLCLSFLRLPTCILPSEGTSQNRTQCPLLLHLPVLQPLGPRPKAQVHAGCGHLLGPGLHPLATFPILDIHFSSLYCPHISPLFFISCVNPLSTSIIFFISVFSPFVSL